MSVLTVATPLLWTSSQRYLRAMQSMRSPPILLTVGTLHQRIASDAEQSSNGQAGLRAVPDPLQSSSVVIL